MNYVYILYNKEIDKYYVGYTGNPNQRLKDHGKGKTRRHYTKNQKGNWGLKYYEILESQKETIRREQEIKSKKSREYIRNLIARKAKCAGSSMDRATAF